MKQDIYERITETIISKLESGTVPWNKPWSGTDGLPSNMVSKKAYRGINTLLLSMSEYESDQWLTYKQAKSLKGQVRKGEKGTTIIFWKFLNSTRTDSDGKLVDKKIPMLRHYTVFNIDQCDGIEKPVKVLPSESEFKPIDVCDNVVNDWDNKPAITHNESKAYYMPSSDTVNMPKRERFNSEEEYYSTLFHELTHSTGNKSRLNRGVNGQHSFRSKDYSKEELVAEMGAAMLCGITGIENNTIDNSASYIASWLKVLKGNPKLVIQAAGQAQKACDMILNTTFTSR